jgi:hypothetical protein
MYPVSHVGYVGLFESVLSEFDEPTWLAPD